MSFLPGTTITITVTFASAPSACAITVRGGITGQSSIDYAFTLASTEVDDEAGVVTLTFPIPATALSRAWDVRAVGTVAGVSVPVEGSFTVRKSRFA